MVVFLAVLSFLAILAASSATSMQSNDLHENITLLSPMIFSFIDFNKIFLKAQSFSYDSRNPTIWSCPSTISAFYNSSRQASKSCSLPNLLRKHIIPGLCTNYTFGIKIETTSPPLRRLTVTSISVKNATSTSRSVAAMVSTGFLIQKSHLDQFKNGLVVIYEIQGYVSPLSTNSSDVGRSNPHQELVYGEAILCNDNEPTVEASHWIFSFKIGALIVGPVLPYLAYLRGRRRRRYRLLLDGNRLLLDEPDDRPWSTLNGDCLQNIFERLDATSFWYVNQVCRHWRSSSFNNEQLWRHQHDLLIGGGTVLYEGDTWILRFYLEFLVYNIALREGF